MRATTLSARIPAMVKAYRARIARKKSVMPIDRRVGLHRNRNRLWVSRKKVIRLEMERHAAKLAAQAELKARIARHKR